MALISRATIPGTDDTTHTKPLSKTVDSELRFPNRICVKPVAGGSTAAIGQNVISWHDCRLDGKPANCPAGYSDTYSITAYLTGTVDRANHTASGTWFVDPISLPTNGDWSAGQ